MGERPALQAEIAVLLRQTLHPLGAENIQCGDHRAAQAGRVRGEVCRAGAHCSRSARAAGDILRRESRGVALEILRIRQTILPQDGDRSLGIHRRDDGAVQRNSQIGIAQGGVGCATALPVMTATFAVVASA